MRRHAHACAHATSLPVLSPALPSGDSASCIVTHTHAPTPPRCLSSPLLCRVGTVRHASSRTRMRSRHLAACLLPCFAEWGQCLMRRHAHACAHAIPLSVLSLALKGTGQPPQTHPLLPEHPSPSTSKRRGNTSTLPSAPPSL